MDLESVVKNVSGKEKQEGKVVPKLPPKSGTGSPIVMPKVSNTTGGPVVPKLPSTPPQEPTQGGPARGLEGVNTLTTDGMLDVGDIPQNIRFKLTNSFIGRYLVDPGYTDLKYNGTTFWVQHNTKGRYVPTVQPTIEEVEDLITTMANDMGRTLTDTNMEMNIEVGYLRVNAIHSVVSVEGMSFAMRVSRPRLAIKDLDEISHGNGEVLDNLFNLLIKAEQNLLVSGRTGTGKTELQKYLIQYTSNDSNIVLIEDTRDSHIKTIYPEKDITSWRTVEGEYEMADGVRSALRNNPDWVIIAETRGAVSADILDSAKTDHAIITTLHAKSALAIPSRLIPMIRQSDQYARTDDQVIGNEIVEHLKFGIQLRAELIDNKMVRYISEIVEYTGFTPRGAVGNTLYKFGYHYDRETGEYQQVTELGKLSEETASELENKRLIHLLPDVFNPFVDDEEE